MAQPFSFGFSGDDIEDDPNDVMNHDENIGIESVGSNDPPPIEARTHDLYELLSTVPDKLSYTTLSITSPKGFTIRVPRRELFDVRIQLMAEDDGTSLDALSGLDDLDVKTNIYEGGYKTWECSIDLVKFLLDRGPRKDLDDLVRVDHVIEMGCGTALPSLLLFHYALKNAVPLYITLTDYNADVLRLVTLPNLLLTFASTLPEHSGQFTDSDSGDIEVTEELKRAFKSALTSLPITLTLLSGSWTPVPRLLSLIPTATEMNTFILASETIYSPASLAAFTEAMAALLGRVKSGKAVVAAKRVYFGVGGSIDEFREECARKGCVAYEMELEGLEGVGVRRCLVEVQMY
ncbi:hypothetical protein K469DRAFT_719562 [Zopfia rhizophila CBS 207.26]|uniref:protein-histidine N-methyltransferase n=1 Tax=Zopfia rhizophila CBS 207.26 TaxID=1314779 RepID=A0A6A6DGX6_9PEZI|nr:hypothetical protein K469DRAFT_719562 [Zopfia rhizophila CBS 207.26]